MAGRFGQWGGGSMALVGSAPDEPLTGTVTTPPSTPSAPSASSAPTSGQILTSPGGGGSSGGAGGDSIPAGGLYGAGYTPSTPSESGGGVTDPSGGFSPNMSASAGAAYFDEGGVVPTGNDTDDTNSPSTIDPMQALTFGRQQMGLPSSFYGGSSGAAASQPAMFDGGVVPDPNNGQGQDQNQDPSAGTGQAVNPQSAVQYLAGAGGVSPDIADAMEKRADPQGQLSPAERVMAAIQSAGNPKDAFGLMQHYRTKFNAYGGAARAALDQGDLGQAAAHATSAMANVPTGYNVQFAPARGGIAMSASKIKQQAQQQGFDNGGETDEDNPSILMREGYEDGGQVRTDDDDEAGPPLSKNIEDRRGEATPDDIRASDNAYEGQMQNVRNQSKQMLNSKWSGLQDKLGSMPGFDDGGVVPTGDDGDEDDDPNNTNAANGIEPDDDTDEQAQYNTPTGGAGAAPAQGDDTQTTILNPDQFKKALTSGYDAPVEKGWTNFLSELLGGMLGPSQAQAAEPQGQQQTGTPAPGNGSTTPSPSGYNSSTLNDIHAQGGLLKYGANKLSSLLGSRGQEAAAAVAPAFDPNAQTTFHDDPNAQGQGNFPSLADRQKMQFGQKTPGQQGQVGGNDENAMIDRLNQQASKIWPWASQAAQRQQYVQQSLEAARGNVAKLQQTQAMWGNRGQIEQNKEQGRNQRSENAIQGRVTMQNMRDMTSRMNATQRAQLDLLKSRWASQPNLTPDDLIKQVTPIANQIGVHPADLLTAMAGGNQQPGQSQQPQQQNQGGPQVGDRKQINGKWYVWDGHQGVPAQ
jgi:hypothetical protein